LEESTEEPALAVSLVWEAKWCRGVGECDVGEEGEDMFEVGRR
jgi:hypothetical protein